MTDTTAPHTATEPHDTSRSARKRRAILRAATDIFLRDGYLGTNMDDVAAMSEVSKQTIYKQFGSKEALFVEIVTGMTGDAGDTVLHHDRPEVTDYDAMVAYLVDYGFRQLTVVLTPRLMQLRRLVIGEVARFPELAKALYERGPLRAIAAMAVAFEHLAQRGLLKIDDPLRAASHFNWLVMSAPLNDAMLLGDDAIPAEPMLHRYAVQGVEVFLAAYGPKARPARR